MNKPSFVFKIIIETDWNISLTFQFALQLFFFLMLISAKKDHRWYPCMYDTYL